MKNICLLGFISLLFFLFSISCQGKEEPELKREKKIRLPVVAGQFYPGDQTRLSGMIRQFFQKAAGPSLSEKIYGLVSPHAGYIYSGVVAAAGFKQIDPTTKTVFVLAPSHSVSARKASIPEVDFYRTPLGDIPLSPIAATLRRQDLFSPVPQMHQREHSLEVQLPFLQEAIKDFELIPVIIGQTNPKSIAEALLPYIENDTLIVASSDLSHYYPYEKAKALDKICIEAITTLNLHQMAECEACGKIPVLVLMEIARQKGWKGKLIDYRNSGDTAGSKDQVVGYTSIAFITETAKAKTDDKENTESVTEADQETLLSLARHTISEVLSGRKKIHLPQKNSPSYLKEIRGCVVTLHNIGSLRGCIGTIIPEAQLCYCVQENALNAAFHDPRFTPLKKDELDQIDIEISILTLPKQIHFTDAEDLKRQLRPGQDGVILSQGWHRATYLPQVWKQLPNKEHFLESLCRKAGLPGDAWKNPKTKVEIYEAIVFSE